MISFFKKSLIHPLFIVLPVLALASFGSRRAQASWTPIVELSQSPDGMLLSINHRPAMLFQDLDAPWSFPNRPQIVAQRLENLVQRGLNPSSIFVRDTPHGAILMAGGESLLTVTDSEAQSKGLTRQSLAQSWAKALRTLLLLEPLNASPSQALIPFGESRIVKIGGAANGPINCALSPSGVVSATVDQDARQITLAALVAGAGEMQVVVEGESITVPFYVKKYAGRVQDAFVAVTGNGPGRREIHDLARDAVERNLLLEPGATDKIDDSFQIPATIPDQGATLSVPVSLDGPLLLPVRASATVKLVRERVGRDEPNLLFYSNNPEMLRKYYGSLYTQVIKANQAVRLLYHHQSAMSSSTRFSLLIKNGDSPARLQIIDGSADPQIDTFQIGHRAAAKFFPKWLSDSGYIQDLEPGETCILLDQILTHDMTTSGIYHFVLLAGKQATIQLRADPPNVTPEVKPSSLNPEVYSTPRKVINQTYSVGGRWGFISFGREPIPSHDSSHPLEGNYGVIYDLTLDLKNPTDQSNSADVVFDPAAGIAHGVFVVDGKLVEAGVLRPPQEFILGNYPLKPGEERRVHIVTMPLAGSNYPARFSVRPRASIARNLGDK